MLYSIATVCLSGTLRQKIEAIAKAGFRGIEIFENDLITHNGSVSEIRRMIEDHGLEVVTYQPFRDFEGMPEPYRQTAFDRAERKFDLMETLGTDLLMICSNCSPHALGGIQRSADDLHELGERADARGMRVAYEALGWGKHIYDYRDSWEIVRRADHPRIGLCLDSFHIFSRDTELDTMLNIPGDRIFLVQVADAPRLSMDHLSWSRHYRCFPGQGELPIDQFVENLHATGYDGPFSLEIFNDQFRSGSPEKTAVDGYRSLVYANHSAEARQDHHAKKIAARPLTEISPPSDIQFIEFALDKNETVALTTLIGQLGFQHTATHKQKAVELWRQGQINLVMNQEPDSFAQRYHQQHGVSVCAVGLSCENVGQLTARAGQLRYPPVYGNPDTDTHGIPAIKGPGESLLYMVDSSEQPGHWEREFNWHEHNPVAYLNTVDHIATTMSYEEMLHSILLYRAMFSMRSTPSVDVSDPGGLVKSQVMQTPDKAVSFTLNSTQAPGTVSGHILNQYSGTGVNHIALSTNDIFALAKRLEEQSTPTMAVTENYYDDLAARFGLSDELLSQLQRYGILYDEDDQGVFYQLYTQLFSGKFCFEIVQRDGYQGFGTPNSQMRMTMQARELASIL